MKLRLEASDDELATRGPELMARLAKAFAEHAPGLAEALEKALPEQERPLKQRALRELHARFRALYAAQADAMASELAELLETAAHGEGP